jgi:hypothetical protein
VFFHERKLSFLMAVDSTSITTCSPGEIGIMARPSVSGLPPLQPATTVPEQSSPVELVLRRPDGCFVSPSWLMSTLCHELAHIKACPLLPLSTISYPHTRRIAYESWTRFSSIMGAAAKRSESSANDGILRRWCVFQMLRLACSDGL